MLTGHNTVFVNCIIINLVILTQLLCSNRKDSGSFDLSVNALAISTSIAIHSDETGRPTVSSVSCEAHVGSVSVKFHGGAR